MLVKSLQIHTSSKTETVYLMELRPEELLNEGYVLKDSLYHDDLIPFLKESLNKSSTVIKLYYGLNILLFLIIVALISFDFYYDPHFTWAGRFSFLSFGLLFSFLLIPLHEYLHSLAYKFVGAKKTSYDMNLRKFYFMALADRFVMNLKEFRIVALTPFVCISVLCLLAFIIPLGIWKYTVMALLLTHTAFCSGDFALLNYFELNKSKDLVTYDDVEKGVSYIYERP